MHREDLRFEAGYLVALNGRNLDLHNDLDFEGLEYSPKRETLLLRWRRCHDSWVSDGTPARITMVFAGVYLLRVQLSRAADGARSAEGTCLSYAGYLHAEDMDTMDGYLERSEVSGASITVIGFEGGMEVRIGALSASLECSVLEMG